MEDQFARQRNRRRWLSNSREAYPLGNDSHLETDNHKKWRSIYCLRSLWSIEIIHTISRSQCGISPLPDLDRSRILCHIETVKPALCAPSSQSWFSSPLPAKKWKQTGKRPTRKSTMLSMYGNLDTLPRRKMAKDIMHTGRWIRHDTNKAMKESGELTGLWASFIATSTMTFFLKIRSEKNTYRQMKGQAQQKRLQMILMTHDSIIKSGQPTSEEAGTWSSRDHKRLWLSVTHRNYTAHAITLW